MTADLTELAGDSSPLSAHQTTSSVESNFRELDDAFLQNQARIWLGEVLQIRFDEQVDISDLLADGELLFEVSEVISRMLPNLSADETQLKVYEWKTLASNKSTRRYMPYHNVDSFVRMCKKLGMDGIDLFTPSDVVERRNTRKVCMCLRSLSKKSRLRDLNVPDFDSVTCTLTMPTDMVGYIRKSLEMSESSSSLLVEQEAEKVSRVRFWRRMSNSESVVSNVVSDNSDEAESKFVVAESNGSSDLVDDADSQNISGPQLIRDIDLTLQLSMTSDLKDEDNDLCEYLSPSKAESVGSPCSQYFSDEELSIAFSNCLGSCISGKVAESNSETKNGYLSGDVSHIPINWGNGHLDVGNDNDANSNGDDIDCVSQVKGGDTACLHDYYPIGNHMCNKNLGTLNNTSEVDCEKSLEFVTDDYYPCEGPRLSYEDDPSNNNAAKQEPFVCEVWPDDGAPYSHGKTNDNVIPAEQIIQSSCVSKPSESPDYLYKNENQASSAYIEVRNVGGNSCCDRLNNGNATSDVGNYGGQLSIYEEQSPCSVDYDEYNCKDSSLLAFNSHNYDDYMGNKEYKSFDMPHLDLNSSPDMVVAKSRTKYSKDCHDTMEGFEGHDSLVESVDDKPTDIDIAIPTTGISTAVCDSQLEAQSPRVLEDIDHKQLQCVKEVEKGESGFVNEESINKEMPLHKPQRKLLKSFAKGTALLGVAVFLLHLRKNRQESQSGVKKRPAKIVIQGAPKSSQKGGSSSSVYPAEKLNFGI